jgi:hypothetical protein
VAHLKDYDIKQLDAHHGAVFGMWRDYRLAYMNDAWFAFAAANGGEPDLSQRWGLGRSLMDCIPAALQDFFLEGYSGCLESMGPWSHEYECSSAHLRRTFHQVAYPLQDGVGFMVVNSLLVEAPYHPDAEAPPLNHDYRDEHGLIYQCAHCRRVRRDADGRHWDWVPEWVTRSPRDTSHSLCHTCYAHYYVMRRGR